jgi:transcriptional regulator with XRE-family HTH domain
VGQARAQSGLTQAAFAEHVATPVPTLRDWEQGRFAPPGGVVCLLGLIIKHPELSQELSAVLVSAADGDKEVSLFVRGREDAAQLFLFELAARGPREADFFRSRSNFVSVAFQTSLSSLKTWPWFLLVSRGRGFPSGFPLASPVALASWSGLCGDAIESPTPRAAWRGSRAIKLPIDTSISSK